MTENTEDVICDRRLYEDYDTTSAVYSKLTLAEKEYFESMNTIGGAGTNDKLFDSVID